jgi:hypothetical protein
MALYRMMAATTGFVYAIDVIVVIAQILRISSLALTLTTYAICSLKSAMVAA